MLRYDGMVVPGTRMMVQVEESFRVSMSVSAEKKAYVALVHRRLKPSDTLVGSLSISGHIIFRYTSFMKGSCESCNIILRCICVGILYLYGYIVFV
jgi:hypothetical protein